MNDMGELQDEKTAEQAVLERERRQLLKRVQDRLETPMLILAFLWLGLLVAELLKGESPLFQTIGTGIWAIFILVFVIEFVLSPEKVDYLKRNWLTAVSLLIPALRIFRVFRVLRLLRLARVGRGVRLVRVVTSLNRGMKALGSSLGRRGFGM